MLSMTMTLIVPAIWNIINSNIKTDIKNKRNINKISDSDISILEPSFLWIIDCTQITSLTIVYSTVYSGADQRKHQSPASLAFVRGIHLWPVNSPHVTRKMFPFDDVIMIINVQWEW